jgi:hypothetical protein
MINTKEGESICGICKKCKSERKEASAKEVKGLFS